MHRNAIVVSRSGQEWRVCRTGENREGYPVAWLRGRWSTVGPYTEDELRAAGCELERETANQKG